MTLFRKGGRKEEYCGIDIWVLWLAVYQHKRVRVPYLAPVFKENLQQFKIHCK